MPAVLVPFPTGAELEAVRTWVGGEQCVTRARAQNDRRTVGIIATLDVDTIEHRQRMDALNVMMDERDFPTPLPRKLVARR